VFYYWVVLANCFKFSFDLITFVLIVVDETNDVAEIEWHNSVKLAAIDMKHHRSSRLLSDWRHTRVDTFADRTLSSFAYYIIQWPIQEWILTLGRNRSMILIRSDNSYEIFLRSAFMMVTKSVYQDILLTLKILKKNG
jgi:hypothetical protein